MAAKNLEAKKCREIASAIEVLDASRDSGETILRQESAWIRRAYGWKGQWVRLFTYNSMRTVERSFATKMKAHERRARLLLLNFASRAYELERGTPPKSDRELVPAYIKALPVDPVTGNRIVYIR